MSINEDIAQRVEEIEREIQGLGQQAALNLIWEESKELEHILEQHHPFLATAANIGFGKTTATRFIAKFGRARHLEEPVEDNFLLQTYYTDMKKYSFPLQIQLINDRLFTLILHRREYPRQPLVSDRSIYEDTEIFCEAFVKQELMEPQIRDYLKQYLQHRTRELEQRYEIKLTPDLILFLKGDIDTGWKRVQGRARGMELREDARKGVGLTREFYETLQQEYEKFPERLQQYYSGPLLVLPQDRVEVSDASSSKGMLYVVKSVKEALKVAFEV